MEKFRGYIPGRTFLGEDVYLAPDVAKMLEEYREVVSDLTQGHQENLEAMPEAHRKEIAELKAEVDRSQEGLSLKLVNEDLVDEMKSLETSNKALTARLQKAEGVLRKVMECGDMRWKVQQAAEYFVEASHETNR